MTNDGPVGHFKVGHYEVWIAPRGTRSHTVTVVDGRDHVVVRRSFTVSTVDSGSLSDATHMARHLVDGIAIGLSGADVHWFDGGEKQVSGIR